MKTLLTTLIITAWLPTAFAQTDFSHPPVGGHSGAMPAGTTSPAQYRMPSDMVAQTPSSHVNAQGSGSNHAGSINSPRLPSDMLVPLSMPKAPELPNEGTVINTANAGGYSYIEVSSPSGNVWLAAPAMRIKAGDKIRYDNGAMMRDFTSKSMGRTFSSISFIGGVTIVSSQ